MGDTHLHLPRHFIPRRLLVAFLAGLALLIPWTIHLAIALPRRDVVGHYDVMWVGFDALLIAFMVAVAVLAFRRSPRIEIPAAVLSVLLVVDLWFDFMTDDSTRSFVESTLSAVLVEIPTALVLTSIVWRIEHSANREFSITRRSRLVQPSSEPTTETNDTISPG